MAAGVATGIKFETDNDTEAACRFLERGGPRAVITCPEEIELAVEGRAGTILER